MNKNNPCKSRCGGTSTALIRVIRVLLACLVPLAAQAQLSTDTIQVVARSNATPGSIQLRWSVQSPEAWRYTNQNGFVIERYTVLRDNVAVEPAERKLLTLQPFKPRPLNDWEQIVETDDYAAIIAQALYGETFEVSGGQQDVGYLIALSQEQEQRFAMAMVAAEMSWPAALMAGWGYEDTDVRPGERYLYRIIPVCPDDKKTLEIGSVYTGLDDADVLPQVSELHAIWGNGVVLLTWNSQLLERTYCGYYLERATADSPFQRLNKTPLTNITGKERIFYTDSITNGLNYSYRVIGLTPFGQEGQPSDTIEGRGIPRLIYNPNIRRAMPNEAGDMQIDWEFDERGNADISGFELRRGDTDKGPFLPVVKDIPPTQRSVIYDRPQPENYLVIAAISLQGDTTLSFPYFLQMEDTVPPAIPQGLRGEIDTLGIVRLCWTPNTDADILGYKLYRGQTAGEELIPLNDLALPDTTFTDTIGIYNLNSRVYYALTALDKRYNQSDKTEVLVLEKPAVVPPTPPLLTVCKAEQSGIRLEWVAGEEPVSAFVIYRTTKGTTDKQAIQTLTNVKEKTCLDTTVIPQTTYLYEVTAIGPGGLESDVAPALSATAVEPVAAAAITHFKGKRTEQGIVLTWEHSVPAAKSVQLYRKEGDGALSLWQTLNPRLTETTDPQAKPSAAYEYLLVVKTAAGMPVSQTLIVK